MLELCKGGMFGAKRRCEGLNYDGLRLYIFCQWPKELMSI